MYVIERFEDGQWFATSGGEPFPVLADALRFARMRANVSHQTVRIRNIQTNQIVWESRG